MDLTVLQACYNLWVDIHPNNFNPGIGKRAGCWQTNVPQTENANF